MENRKGISLRGVAVVAILLFVALAVVPVAAVDVIDVAADTPWNTTYVPIANPPVRFDSTPLGNPYYFINLTNSTGGMNAIHITENPTNLVGECYSNKGSSGTFYVGDTGGRKGQDDIILIVAINSTTAGVLENFAINITSSGYTWVPTTNGIPNSSIDPWTTVYSVKPFNSGDYLENTTGGGTTDLFQEWKFAPTADYPIYCGQNMESDLLFKLIEIDLKVGTINGTWWNITTGYGLNGPPLMDNGLANITYTITSTLDENTKVAFNVYAYNNQTIPQQPNSLPPAVNWLNKVNNNDESEDGASGWLVGSP